METPPGTSRAHRDKRDITGTMRSAGGQHEQRHIAQRPGGHGAPDILHTPTPTYEACTQGREGRATKTHSLRPTQEASMLSQCQ